MSDDLLPDDPALAAAMARELGELESDEDAGSLLHGIRIRAIARLQAGARADDVVGERVSSSYTTPYRDYFKVEDHNIRHKRYDGQWTDPLDRAAFVCGDAVTVLPYDPVRDEVLMVEQFRVGPYARGDDRCWLLEPIAGRMDRLEAPAENALREAQEEAGLSLSHLIKITDYYSSPGACTEYITSFLAIADLSNAGGVHGLHEEGEDIRSVLMPAEEALAMIGAGGARNGPLVISLLYLQQHRANLRQEAGVSG